MAVILAATPGLALVLAVSHALFRHGGAVAGNTGYLYGTVVTTGDATTDGRVRLDTGETVDAQVEAQAGAGEAGPLVQVYRVGDRVQIVYQRDPSGELSYAVSDWQRSPALLWLVVLLVLVVAVVARGKGLRALASTAASTLAVGSISLHAAHITNFGDEESTYIAVADVHVRLQGLGLAAVVIGALLGALVDVTVGQAATVAELAHLRPTLGVRELYTRAMRVGLDHIGSLINTLVLAYLSSALPLSLLLRLSGAPGQDNVNTQLIAVEITHTLAGSLVLAVPATPVVAATLFRGDRRRDPHGSHIHAHAH